MKKITVFLFAFIYCFHELLIVAGAIKEKVVLGVDPFVSLPNESTKPLNRQKRGGGGGGFIPFRPLFVYREQQRKKQAKWKAIEEKKRLNEQWLEYQQYQNGIKPNQLTYVSHPATQYSSHNYPSSNYYSTYYPSYAYYSTYPSYYGETSYDGHDAEYD